MKKNILLPTDFSENAWSAAIYALKLYQNLDCKFYFLNSYKMKVSTMSSFSNKLLETVSNQAKDELKEIKNKAENYNTNTNHEFEIIISSGDLYDAIDASIEKYNIDLIVMGTKGATGAKELFLGSNTVNIIKKVKKAPVLIVPDRYDFVEPKQLAFPTDFNRFYGDELSPLKVMSERYNSKIRIIHINEQEKLTDVQNSNLSHLKSYFKADTYSLHWKPGYTKKTQAIYDFIKEEDINILVMINYEHSFIENIVNEPVIKNLGYQLTIPFLVIPCTSC